MAERRDGGQRAHPHRDGRGWVPVHDDPAHPRLFFAVPLPEEARSAIADLAARVQAGVADGHAHIRWVRMDGLHLTLRFLGPTPVETVPALSALADGLGAATPPIEVELGGAGGFPSIDHPRSLWIGLRAGADRLDHLAAAIEAGVVATGAHAPEGRPFTPHLTIARTDGVRAAPDAAHALAAGAADLAVRFTAHELVLYRSFLGDGPARYEPIHAARLAGVADGR